MLVEFPEKRVLIVGAARGIGRAITTAFAERRAETWAADLLADDLPKTAGVRNLAVDVTDKDSVAAMVRQAGEVDILVYVAGGVRGQTARPLEEVPAEDWRVIVEANLTGAFLCAQAVVPAMKAKGRGRIVTISSRAGLATSLTGIQSYAAAKHGQVGLVRQLAQELGPHGITVNSVAPGFMATSPDYERQWAGYTEEFRRTFAERIAMRRMGTPEDVAHAVLFLASDFASWITGQTLPVTGSPLA